MTTPIPEAAVEAAARFLFWHPDNTFDEVPEDHRDRIMAMERALEILTAARPHMEADEAERIAAWITAEPQNDNRVNDTMILLADALRRGDYRAATIAERTQR